MLATYGPTAMPVSVGWWRWDVAGPLPLVSRRAARDLWTHRNARFSRMVAVGCRWRSITEVQALQLTPQLRVR